MMKLLTDAEVEAKPTVTTVPDARKSDFVNNFGAAWRTVRPRSNAIWEGLRAIMIVEGALDPLAGEMIYIAESTGTAAARRIISSQD